MAERLSASDMSSLLAERGPIHVHVGGTIVVEGKPPKFAELLRHVTSRMHLVPRFRQKITGSPIGLSNPSWEDDTTFDLRRHVHHFALPPPGSPAQLREAVGRVMSEPLDLSKPLWQLYLIEGLNGNRHAYVSKTHHALVDGVSAVDVGMVMLDPDPKGTKLPRPKRSKGDDDEPQSLWVAAAGDRLRDGLRLARGAARGLRMPRTTAKRVIGTAEGFASLAAGGPKPPRTSFNVDIGRDRRVAFAKTKLERLKAARGTGKATINDVVLAVATDALRRFMLERGDDLPDQIVGLVPMSIRRSDEKLELGNRITTLMVPLPMTTASPRRRLQTIHRDTERLKASEQARAASLIIEATGWAPPTINRVLAMAMSRPLNWNLVISNVPGPQLPLYLLGRRVLEVYPFVPLSPQGHALAIGIVSYNGEVFFGLVGDRDVVPDLDRLAKAFREALRELPTR